MSTNGNTQYNRLFSSLVSDIKSYNGNDPLLPWLCGIRKMKDLLPPQLLKEKLPRFLQKCTQTFLNDRRYSNDLRYLRVWLQLMDFVDDPKGVLRTMEMNGIGMKKSLFYMAYALCYEKMKKFDAAEKIYHLGVQNLAEPSDELQKSYELFLHRMEGHRNKKIQHQGWKITGRDIWTCDKVKVSNEKSLTTDESPAQTWHEEYLPEMRARFVNTENKIYPSKCSKKKFPLEQTNHNYVAERSGDVGLLSDQLVGKAGTSDIEIKTFLGEVKVEQDENRKCNDDMVVNKFVDTALFEKSNAENARHHGLVEPTINMKEAMNAINSMFREPLDGNRTGRSQIGKCLNNGFTVFPDESLEIEVESSQKNLSKDPSISRLKRSDSNQPLDKPFEIFVDSEETNDVREKVNDKAPKSGVNKSGSHVNACVYDNLNNRPIECLKDSNSRRAPEAGLREDTVIYRFVGSTISDEPEVENVWHRGLVEPTINLKEAMNDINSMFGKPIEFTRKGRPKNQDKASDVKKNCGQFLILPDDEVDNQNAKDDANCMFLNPLNFARRSSPRKQDELPDVMANQAGFLIFPDDELVNQQYSSCPSSSAENGSDLYEQTLCTKEAMAEISKLFAMPMDF